MTEKEMRRLSRAELLELLVMQINLNKTLKAELENAKEQLENRRVQLEEAGSIAEASLRLNDVFQAAQNAADQYLENIKRMQDDWERCCSSVMDKTEKETQKQLWGDQWEK